MRFHHTILLTSLMTMALSLPTIAETAMESPDTQNTSMQDQSTNNTSNANEQSVSAASQPAVQLTEHTERKIDVNTATAKKLRQAGLSHSQARAIVSYRKAHGDFSNLADLRNINRTFKKMKKAKFDKLVAKLMISEATQ